MEPGVPCTEANKCPLVQIVANHHVSDRNRSEEIHSPVPQGTETIAVRKVIPKKEEEFAASQNNYSFELQEIKGTAKGQ